MDPDTLLLLLVAAPGGVYTAVTAGVAALTVAAWGHERRAPRDPRQEEAFRGRRAGLLRRAAWIGVEGFWTTIGFGWQLLHATTRRTRLRIDPAPGGTPVLLLAGYLENSAQMALLARRLRARGFRTARLDLSSTLRPLAENVAALRQAVEEVRRVTGAERVAIVGHSMGGVLGRALVHSEPAPPVPVVITIASPHRGTRLAVLGPGRSARDMRLGSAHMQAHPPEKVGAVPVHTLIGFQENIVAPAWSTVLEEGENLVLDVPAGHLTPLYLRRTADQVTRWLEAAGVERAAPAPDAALTRVD